MRQKQSNLEHLRAAMCSSFLENCFGFNVGFRWKNTTKKGVSGHWPWWDPKRGLQREGSLVAEKNCKHGGGGKGGGIESHYLPPGVWYFFARFWDQFSKTARSQQKIRPGALRADRKVAKSWEAKLQAQKKKWKCTKIPPSKLTWNTYTLHFRHFGRFGGGALKMGRNCAKPL